MIENQIKRILADTLNLGKRADEMTRDTALLGALPELDSLGVVTLITKLEEQFDITVLDDEISGDTFATFGSLVRFVEHKMPA